MTLAALALAAAPFPAPACACGGGSAEVIVRGWATLTGRLNTCGGPPESRATMSPGRLAATASSSEAKVRWVVPKGAAADAATTEPRAAEEEARESTRSASRGSADSALRARQALAASYRWSGVRRATTRRRRWLGRSRRWRAAGVGGV